MSAPSPAYLQLFRAVFPSWRFFDDVFSAPVLWVRASVDGREFGPWHNCLPKAERRRWWNLFLNSRENALFAAHSLLDQFAEDLEQKSASPVSRELVENLARWCLQEFNLAPPEATQFQLKLTLEEQVLYVSPTMGRAG